MSGNPGENFRRRLKPVFATILIFALIGPPLGGLVLAFLLPVFVLVTHPEAGVADLPGRMPGFTRMFLGSVPQSYLAGGIQAGLTGAILSVYGSYRGKPAYLAALAASAAVWAGFIVLGPRRDALEALFLLVVHVVPALICTRVARPFWKEAI